MMKVKEESEKAGLKLNIQKTNIVASSPITSWQTDGETMETVTDFTFLGSKVTADSACSHEIKRCLLLGRKAMTNLDSRRQEEKGTTEDEMVGWHHRLERHGFEEALGAGDGQGSLACCSPWVTESDMSD